MDEQAEREAAAFVADVAILNMGNYRRVLLDMLGRAELQALHDAANALADACARELRGRAS